MIVFSLQKQHAAEPVALLLEPFFIFGIQFEVFVVARKNMLNVESVLGPRNVTKSRNSCFIRRILRQHPFHSRKKVAGETSIQVTMDMAKQRIAERLFYLHPPALREFRNQVFFKNRRNFTDWLAATSMLTSNSRVANSFESYAP